MQVTDSAVSAEVGLDDEIKEKCVRLNVVLRSYGVNAEPINPELVQRAARFYRFKLILKPGESINNLKKKREDIARELEAVGEVFVDNIKGTRFVGLDVPFSNSVEPLSLLDNLYKLKGNEYSLGILAGQQPDGEYQCIDLAKAPHMLIAGTTGSGKTIFLYSIIISLLSKMSANEIELLIIDPKQTDFHFFESLPCLRGNRVLIDADEALKALERINTIDKEERTQQIRSANSRDIDSYNAKNPEQRMKRLIIVIDEYADLVQAAELQGKDIRKSFEANLCMLAQRVRNLGIHLVIATQQPRATIVTSSLKAVLPFRASFRLPSHIDSQTILDRAGAEDLLGKGDMLMQTDSDLLRMQGFYISEEELVDFLNKWK
jgi:DNA segregation ATPase FtsK/SpoIIIE-like protein